MPNSNIALKSTVFLMIIEKNLYVTELRFHTFKKFSLTTAAFYDKMTFVKPVVDFS